ncbi:hypothetical protein FNB15_07065 [Ferrovibrio terrae]|uniref:DUF2059 domain-containing protein n=1 Tax=Ferrovibrio terrae TaxID=2594003 RepID=A0A516GZU2_9PROT|nr:hypothetical protein [Ferrovibrio terrae]QDO97048.1 hypothetical protein FNB15_07065 [Ferrovibrio terrae]
MSALRNITVAALLSVALTACVTAAPKTDASLRQQEAQVVARAFPVEQMLAEQIALSRRQLYVSLSREFPGKDASIETYVEEFQAANMRAVLEDLVGVVADEFAANFTAAELQVFRRVLLSPAGQEAMQPGVPTDKLSPAAINALLEIERNVDHGRMAAFGQALGQRHKELALLARLRAERAQELNKARLAELGLQK